MTPRASGGRRTEDLVARDLAHLWHPFTQHSVWPDDDPLIVERAEGMYLYDSEGRRYLDGVSSLWVTVHGHREPRIDHAIKKQMDRLAHTTFLGLTHEPGIVLAEKLLASAPSSLNRVFYAGDGASAVEAAIKMAYQAAAQRGEFRPLYVHLAEGYHGDTLGAVSVGGIETFHATYRPILLETRQVSSPGVLRPGQTRAERAHEVTQELREVLDRDGDRVCAIIVEPLVQAAAGMLTHDGSFLRGARALADEFGALMIADEVATGIGRTGRMWAVDGAAVRPDLLTCGKGLSGGYLPISAVLASEAVYEAFLGTPASGRTFFHGHTYTANPLACAAAVANLDLMAERGTVEHAAKVGERMGELLTPLERHEGVVEIRRLGTMVGIEVRDVGERTGFRVCQAARRRGVWLRPLGDVVICMPPLAIEDEQVEELCGAATEAIDEVFQ
ncbi:MAG: adenosylmethionine--8-amino-7-oxononanoate transaminase [Streptosporangiales bacterium]|nr:adenosylmethionine--8-amino-7-oxononanoate transaminase [Streptosporangiales bacterium]